MLYMFHMTYQYLNINSISQHANAVSIIGWSLTSSLEFTLTQFIKPTTYPSNHEFL